MASQPKSSTHLEIAHVLFIDVVDYSKQLIDEQKELQQQLNKIVRGTDQFRAAEAESKLIRLPSGDGMALVFFTSPEVAVQCALEISEALRSYPKLQVRMGINTGPVSGVEDVNDRSNIAGSGINIAQRVMAFADAGHILLSKRAAEDLLQYRDWQPHLHDLGEFEVKHGQRVSIVNLYTETIGNPHFPAKLRQEARRQAASRRLRRTLIAGMLLLIVALPIGWLTFSNRNRTAIPAVIPEKSIAVLPFENLSSDKENAYFAEGVQDEILTRLAKIADLKVISRTSTQRYKSAPRNLGEIAKQLGVANILEGSVQKAADQVRVNVQLIKAQTDSHLLADTYDRKLTDIFAVESEVAEKIATSLQARLTGREQQALKSIPTDNPEAYDLYLRGRYLLNKRTVASIQGARELFQEAVAKDPRLAIGHAGIADAYILLAEYGEISNAEASLLAWPELSLALAIDDRLSGAHASRAILLENFDWNWPAADVEYRKAIELNPNDRTARHWYALYLAELGRFDEALGQIDVARKLDPLAPVIRAAKGKILFIARRYDEAITECQAALDLAPNFPPALDAIVPSYTAQRKFREAIEATSRYADPSDNDTSLELAYIYTVAGQNDRAEQLVRKVTSSPESFSAYDMATIRAAGHNEAEALRWLETAIERRSLSVVWIRVDPRLDNIRSNPRFRELVGRVAPRRPPPK